MVSALSQVLPSTASSYVCLGDDVAEPLVVGMVVAPDDVPPDHVGLLLPGAAIAGSLVRRHRMRNGASKPVTKLWRSFPLRQLEP
jgi:hypothetical protein